MTTFDPSAEDALEDADRLAFSCVCWLCDARVDDRHAAAADGWQGITYDDGVSWNYVGDCPTCAEGGQGVLF